MSKPLEKLLKEHENRAMMRVLNRVVSLKSATTFTTSTVMSVLKVRFREHS